MIDDAQYHTTSTTCAAGSRFLFLTDGLYEVQSPDRCAMLGLDGLQKQILQLAGQQPVRVVRAAAGVCPGVFRRVLRGRRPDAGGRGKILTRMKTILITDDQPHLLIILEYNLARTGCCIVQRKQRRGGSDQGAGAPHRHAHRGTWTCPASTVSKRCAGCGKLPGYAEVPVIVITGSFHNDTETRARAAGASAFINKPYSPMDLAANTVKGICSKFENRVARPFHLCGRPRLDAGAAARFPGRPVPAPRRRARRFSAIPRRVTRAF